jgi:hypothetical protein
MKIYFGDPEYDGQFLRSVDYAPAGAQFFHQIGGLLEPHVAIVVAMQQ